MALNQHMKLLSKELEHFNSILNELLPRYKKLMEKNELSFDEKKELGDMEYFLIEINGKIAEIKNKLDQDLFGETLNLYYLTKAKAKLGSIEAKTKLDGLRSNIQEGLKSDLFFNWN